MSEVGEKTCITSDGHRVEVPRHEHARDSRIAASTYIHDLWDDLLLLRLLLLAVGDDQSDVLPGLAEGLQLAGHVVAPHVHHTLLVHLQQPVSHREAAILRGGGREGG